MCIGRCSCVIARHSDRDDHNAPQKSPDQEKIHPGRPYQVNSERPQLDGVTLEKQFESDAGQNWRRCLHSQSARAGDQRSSTATRSDPRTVAKRKCFHLEAPNRIRRSAARGATLSWAGRSPDRRYRSPERRTAPSYRPAAVVGGVAEVADRGDSAAHCPGCGGRCLEGAAAMTCCGVAVHSVDHVVSHRREQAAEPPPAAVVIECVHSQQRPDWERSPRCRVRHSPKPAEEARRCWRRSVGNQTMFKHGGDAALTRSRPSAPADDTGRNRTVAAHAAVTGSPRVRHING